MATWKYSTNCPICHAAFVQLYTQLHLYCSIKDLEKRGKPTYCYRHMEDIGGFSCDSLLPNQPFSQLPYKDSNPLINCWTHQEQKIICTVYSGDDPMEIWGTGMLVVGPSQLIVMQVRSHSRTTNNFNFTIMAIIVDTNKSNRRTLSNPHSIFISSYVINVIQCMEVNNECRVVANFRGLNRTKLFLWHSISE